MRFILLNDNILWLGAFMALVLLSSHPFLQIAQRLYARTLGPAFYGLRTTLVTLVMMSLLRIKRAEHLRRDDPVKLGRILGLDRVQEVKTLRRKLTELASKNCALEWMEELGRAHIKSLKKSPEVVYVDGHVEVYSGKDKIGKVFSTQKNKVLKGRTGNWVHLPGGQPILSLFSPFNEKLSDALPEVMKKSRELLENQAVTCVFDRGGWSTALLESVMEGGDYFITYRKGSYEDIPVSEFEAGPIELNAKTYSHKPYEQLIDLEVHEKAKGGKRPQKSGRVIHVREIRVLREDGGQTSILSNRMDLKPEEIAALQFGRWGAQENGFKYLKEEFDIDALWSYGSDELGSDWDHPNPKYCKLEKAHKKKVEARRKELERLWKKYARERKEKDREKWQELIEKKSERKEFKKLHQLNEEIVDLEEKKKGQAKRETAEEGKYRALKSESKLLSNVIKMVAYELESKLYGLLEGGYRNKEKEGRSLIASALKSGGSLKLSPGKLLIELEAQSSPNRTRSINAICQKLNQRKAKFPGSNRVIEFIPTPVKGEKMTI